MTRKTHMAVHIILDTNSLFTEAADKLIREELSAFILEWLERHDVNVNWHLPEIVRAERKYQMQARAQKLLPQLAKVESLLGHSFGITNETLEERVEAAIRREVERHRLAVQNINVTQVEWSDLILRAVQRQPPFDTGEKEKGFRDAIVLETFCQLIDSLPRSSQSCRIILMTGDKLITLAAQERAQDRTNVTFADDLEVVRTALNALASTLSQQEVANILPEAHQKFVDADDDKSLYYKERVQERISKQYQAILKSRPSPDFTAVGIKQLTVSPPVFVSKVRQRLSFSSRVTYQVEATKTVWRTAELFTSYISATPGSGGNVLSSSAPLNPWTTAATNLVFPPAPTLRTASGPTGPIGPTGAYAGLSGSPVFTSLTGPTGPTPTQVLQKVRREGRHIFEVEWSATIGSSGSLTRAKLGKIEHKSTAWEEEA
jgi:hypothetical protein